MFIESLMMLNIFLCLLSTYFLAICYGIKKFTYTTLIVKSRKLKIFKMIFVFAPLCLFIIFWDTLRSNKGGSDLGSSDCCFFFWYLRTPFHELRPLSTVSLTIITLFQHLCSHQTTWHGFKPISIAIKLGKRICVSSRLRWVVWEIPSGHKHWSKEKEVLALLLH